MCHCFIEGVTVTETKVTGVPIGTLEAYGAHNISLCFLFSDMVPVSSVLCKGYSVPFYRNK